MANNKINSGIYRFYNILMQPLGRCMAAQIPPATAAKPACWQTSSPLAAEFIWGQALGFSFISLAPRKGLAADEKRSRVWSRSCFVCWSLSFSQQGGIAAPAD